MGYRSDVTDVTLLVSKKGFKALKEFIGRNNNDEEYPETYFWVQEIEVQ